ncbi:hypothetical protein G9A89_018061 [Geosiphon pyriformis]|nr:hypothetical protein G9A89_018061 [Geosiphon pyriformis]
MANDFIQVNILATLQDIQTALERKNNISLPLFKGNVQDLIKWLDDFERTATANQYDNKYKFQIVGGYLQNFPAIWFSQETDANWHIELEKRTQGSRKIITKYAKAIRKLIKQVDLGKNWMEEQKIHFFTKKLRTNLLYAFWLFLVLKDNYTMDMAIELAQKIEDNQKMHLRSTFPVFAFALVMAFAPQIAAISFAAQIQDLNKQLIDRLTANLAQLLELLTQAVRKN